MSTKLDQDVKKEATLGLAAIHNKDTLPYLFQLLRSSDSWIRSLAVGAFSSFTTNRRVTAPGEDGSASLDEVLNPTRPRQLPSPQAPYETPETRAFLHFGRFETPQEEERLISFWRDWYLRNEPDFRQE